MDQEVPRGKRTIKSFSSANSIRVTLPLPEPGEIAEVAFPLYGVHVVIERVPQESEEKIRERFVVTSPVGKDNRTHAARLGGGTINPKKLGITLCTEGKAESLATGNRINGLPLDAVTCAKCQNALIREGVNLPGKEGSKS